MKPDSSSTPDLRARGVPIARSLLQLDIAALTDRGRERGHNEDSLLVARHGGPGSTAPCAEAVAVDRPEWVALAVCDGMGGAAAGEVASRSAVEVIHEVLAAGGPVVGLNELGRRLITSIEEASRRIHERARRQRDLLGMGTTATVCALSGDALLVAQVGDSRAYLLRAGRLTQITRDQTLAALMLERGQLAEADLASFPFGHIILQAVGTTPQIEVDLVRLTVRRGDVLLVCSDGLSGPVADETIRAALEQATTPEAAGEALIALANAAGGPDNVTCIVARLDGDALEAAGDDATVALERGAHDPAAEALARVPAASPEATWASDARDASRDDARASRRAGAIDRVLAFFRGRKRRSTEE